MVHASALKALGDAEEFSFVGDGEDDGVRPYVSGACFPGCVDGHRERDAHGQVVADDDVVVLDFVGLVTAARIALRVKRSST